MARTPTDPTKAQVWVTKGLDDLDFEFYFPQGPKGDPGGIVNGTPLGAANLNEIVTTGVYRQDSGSNATALNNYPFPNSGVLLVFQSAGAGYLSQQYMPLNGGTLSAKQFYRREFVTPSWGPWRLYASSRVDQTAGRAIYQFDDVNMRDQLIYGDTGYRNITTLLGDVSTGAVYLRRMGGICSLSFSNVEFTNPSSTVVHTYNALLPAGFRSAWAARYPLSPSAGQITVYGSTGNIDLVKGVSTTLFNEVIWTTNDTWPTSLPGVSAATIPNL